MRSHRYIRREGSPGHYRYFYYDPATGTEKAADDGSDDHKKAQVDHLKRLIAGRIHGHHSLSVEEMAAHTGLTRRKVQEHEASMRAQGRRRVAASGTPLTGDAVKHGHDYTEDQLKEAHTDPSHASYPHPASPSRPGGSASAATPTPRARPRRAAATPAAAPAPAARTEAPAPAAPSTPATPAAETPAQEIARLRRLLAEHHVNLGDEPSAAKQTAERVRRTRAARSEGPLPGARTLQSETANAERGVHDPDATAVRAAPTTERASAHATAERVRQAKAALRSPASPTSPHATALGEADPAFAESDRPIKAMVQEQARGGNPYLKRAKEVHSKITGDLKPERDKAVKSIFQAMDKLKAAGMPVNNTTLLAEYKALPGNEAKRVLPKDEFEKGTFMTLDEVVNNPPINIEVERMKHGYPAKQFLRMKPFLKASFLSSHPTAPPPMPTFGDVKSWTEHQASGGGPKPTWAGSTKLALPESVYNASHKSPDGKPKYPPAWMPIHLMPVWSYVAKTQEKSQGAGIWEYGSRNSPYAADKHPERDQTSPTGWKVDMGSQARSGAEFAERGPEGAIVNALRKYIQMRGGENQLTDIPASKLSEAGLSHEDIFKAKGDGGLKKLIRTKIIDPVALMPFIDEELKGKKDMKKSFTLVVNSTLAPIDFKKSFTVPLSKSDIVKARILKIQRLINEKTRA